MGEKQLRQKGFSRQQSKISRVKSKVKKQITPKKKNGRQKNLLFFLDFKKKFMIF
ncbi:MAG: hypothetical protein CM15mV53_630 [uncultured marine virus]|nr:MAG: hypothetical protein CM15mV53_630 [uncultured marine virus]